MTSVFGTIDTLLASIPSVFRSICLSRSCFYFHLKFSSYSHLLFIALTQHTKPIYQSSQQQQTHTRRYKLHERARVLNAFQQQNQHQESTKIAVFSQNSRHTPSLQCWLYIFAEIANIYVWPLAVERREIFHSFSSEIYFGLIRLKSCHVVNCLSLIRVWLTGVFAQVCGWVSVDTLWRLKPLSIICW